MSSRLFASFILAIDMLPNFTKNVKDDAIYTSKKGMRVSQSSDASFLLLWLEKLQQQIRSLLIPLLRVIVQAEITSLKEASTPSKKSQDGEGNSTTEKGYFAHQEMKMSSRQEEEKTREKREVGFSGLDCSSILGPVDSVAGSNTLLEKNVLALSKVVKEIHRICNCNVGNNNKMIRPFQDADNDNCCGSGDAIENCFMILIHFLETCQSEHAECLREACSKVSRK